MRALALLLAVALLAGALPAGQIFAQGDPVVIRGHLGGTGAFVTHANAVLVHVTGKVDCDTCGGGGGGASSIISHVTSVTHVAAASPFPVLQATGTAPWPVTAHQAGSWTISHISSAVHIAGSVSIAGGGLAVNQSGSWTIQAAHQAGEWNVRHVTSVMHIAASEPLPVVQSSQQGAWNVTAHQGGVWNVNHISSVTHVAGVVQAGTGSGNMVCHSTAAFATSATGIIIHAAGSNRIFICGIVLIGTATGGVAFNEGTGAACVDTAAPMLGSSIPGNGLHIVSGGGFVSVASFPWLVTQTAGNNVCLHVSAGRVSGTVTYRGVP